MNIIKHAVWFSMYYAGFKQRQGWVMRAKLGIWIPCTYMCNLFTLLPCINLYKCNLIDGKEYANSTGKHQFVIRRGTNNLRL